MADDPVLREFRDTFRLDDLTIHVDGRWVLSVRPGQITLGSMVVSAASGATRFGALDADDGAGLAAVLASAERLALGVYGAVRLNVVALMMKDPVVHFHVLPRYDVEVARYGQGWRDQDWPGPPTFGPAPTPEAVLFAIRDELRAAY